LSVLTIEGLTIGFENRVLINNISFEIPEPAFLAVLGQNGCGKTTFLKSLINPSVFQGNITIDGKDIAGLGDELFISKLALLGQKNAINFSLPVKELIVMGKFGRKRFFQEYDQADYIEVGKIMQLLNISHLENKDFLEISGGEQQLVWLAQVLLQDTSIILLDEPTQQLDISNKKRVFNLMMDWVNNHNKTIICVTHDVYNLFDMEGYILNLSRKKPYLEPLTRNSIEENIKILENPA
jgi:iron complex transport system ATP-binding protein